MSRRRKEPAVYWKIRLPVQVATAIELLTMDGLTGKPRYGARYRLITALCQRHLREIGFDMSTPLDQVKPLSDADIEGIS